jgi:hypothetical protein
MSRSGSLDPCSAILSRLAKRLGLETKLLEFRLQRQWYDIVGESLASHTWPAQIRFKKLYLIVPNSVWLQQLTFLKPTLLAHIKRACGEEFIQDIVLRVGGTPRLSTFSRSGHPDPGRSSTREEREHDPSAIPINLISPQDPDLRRRFTEVIARYPFRRILPRPEADR